MHLHTPTLESVKTRVWGAPRSLFCVNTRVGARGAGARPRGRAAVLQTPRAACPQPCAEPARYFVSQR